MIKNLKKILIILMFILMATITTGKSYAGFLSEKYFTKDQFSGSEKFSVLLSDLMSNSNWNMLCSEHGQHLPSSNNINNAYSGDYGNYDAILNTVDWVKSYSSTESTNEYVGKLYHSDEVAYYAKKSTNVCEPKAAYVLNAMQEGTNSYGSPDAYTDIQAAWYNTINGGSNNSSLYNQATAYQKFVKKIAKKASDVSDPDTYVTKKHEFEDGTKVSIKFPKIDTEKINSMLSFNTVSKKDGEYEIDKTGDTWASNVTVSYKENSQTYLIGPFSINYIEGGANGVDFGSIEGFDIYTDASKDALSKEQWKFVWTDKNREESNYPHNNEVFYIEMDYIENATMITGMDVDYKYLIAGAEYQTLEGNYDQYVWKIKCDTTETTNEDGSTSTSYKWYFENNQKILAKKAQKLALANKAARWYETTKIEARANQGNLKIVKKALDENGNEMTADQVKERFGEYQYFDFKVTITHSNGKVENDIVTVRAGSSTLKNYSWTGEDKAPTFTVEEIPVSNNSWEAKSIDPKNGTLKNGSTITVTAVNQMKLKRDKIQLSKTISGPADKDETFKFSIDVTMLDGTHDISEATIVVPQGQTTGNVWTSKEYVWAGDKAPTYEITEIATEDSIKYNASITPSKGELDGTGAIINVNALNGEKMSYLTIEKTLEANQVTDDTFDFKVTVDGVKNTDNGKVEFEVLGVKAGEKVGPYGFEWKDPNVAPTYTVEEINIDNDEAKVTTIEETINGVSRIERNTNKITGQLVKDGTANVSVKFTNDMTEHKGGIKVVKEIETPEKISKETLEEEGTKFEIEVTIAGTFVHEGKTYQDTTKVITKTLPDNGKWDFEVKDVVWYGSKAPTFTVLEKNLPTGWKCKTINYSDVENESTDSEGHNLMDGKTITATVVNELPSQTIIDLTFSMAGIVWVDDTLDEKNGADNGYYSAPNGVYDEGETLKENAEVTVFKVVYDKSGNEVGRTVAKAFKDADNNELTFPIITKSDGKWNVPRISVPAVSEEEKENGYSASYDVEFVYDGQTYEPTEFLSYKIASDGTKNKNEGSDAEKAAEYKTAKTVEKDKYAKDSMALEVSNNSKNIKEVSGKTEIDANGETTGVVTLTDGTQKDISYSSDNAGAEYPTRSIVNTTDNNGKVLDVFKATARTSAGTLTFPFDVNNYDGTALTNVDKKITDEGVQTTYKFMAVYNYCLNINLGLKERATTDIGLTKKLDNAKVVVKEKLYQYNYSGNYDLTEEKVSSLDKNIKVENSEEATNIQYTLGLYRSDYYYRAEMYKKGQTTTEGTMYDRLEGFYKTLNTNNPTVQDTEMDIYLTYKIKLMNNSSEYDVAVNSLDDYYDSTLTLVRAEETKYLKTQTVAGKETDVNAEMVVANASDYSDKWTDVKTGIAGSDKDGNGNNIIYNKMTADNLGIKLASGESKEIFVTFKVNKKDTNEAKNAIVLGQKCNVAEISSYSTFAKGTNSYAGRIDRDSAPGNVNIPANNSKVWYEDDTFAAPRINVNFVTDTADRTINGLAWEDNSKDKNTENPGYNQQVGNGIMDSGEDTIKNLTTELVEKVMVPNTDGTYTEYDYIWPTDETLDDLNGKTINQMTGLDSTIVTSSDKGEYTFVNVPSGDYVVRFTYGDKEIESANYSEATLYNGQDYKSAKFNSDLKADNNTIKADSYLNIDAINGYGDVKNTAIDSETRRLQVVANSREIVYDNGKILASSMSNDELKALGYTDTQISEFRTELLKDYKMYAETPKIDMNVELSTFGSDNYTYAVNNINFGLEERPTTLLTLDKQIEEIILTTSDGNTIMDAKYNISYDIAEDGNITAKVELDTRNSYGTDNLQALNRDQATNQGFRYINVDSEILEGTTITVKYRFTVLNTGEVDRTGELAKVDYTTDLNALRNQLSTNFVTYTKVDNKLKNDTVLGKYVGSIYYYGANGDQNDAIVTTTVRQLIDYIDNDATFSGTLNSTANTSWSNMTSAELKELIKDEIITTQEDGTENILDDAGVQYETENRNNIVVSVDNANSNNSLNNSGFIIELMPNNAAGDSGKDRASMNLTTTRYVGSDSDDLQIDNVAEIIKYNNIVGRRDERTIPGNQEPAKALETNVSITTPTTVSAGMVYERDTSATEVITLSPPTGTGLMTWKLQVIGTVTVALAIVAGGIILIKKKILK